MESVPQQVCSVQRNVILIENQCLLHTDSNDISVNRSQIPDPDPLRHIRTGLNIFGLQSLHILRKLRSTTN